MKKQIISLIVVASSLFAGDLVTFTAGTPAKASEVNSNFSELASRIADLQQQLNNCNCNSSNIIFSENFSNSPTVTHSYVLKNGEYFKYDSINHYYKVKILEQDGGIFKYAYLPSFNEISNKSFELSFDFNLKSTSFGMPIGISFGNDFENTGRMNVGVSGSQDMRISFSDGNNPSHKTTNSISLNRWYNFKLTYDTINSKANVTITDKEDNSTFFESNDIDFNPIPFSKVGMGYSTINNDGTSAEMYYDNILIKDK